LRPNERPGQPALPAQPSYKACKSSPEEIQQNVEMLLQHMPFRVHWTPVDQLLKLGGVTLLLKIIAFAYEWNYSGRAETVRSALDVLAIACVMPKVQLLFCDRVDLPEESATVGGDHARGRDYIRFIVIFFRNQYYFGSSRRGNRCRRRRPESCSESHSELRVCPHLSSKYLGVFAILFRDCWL
jgi:hypothetical protein